MIGTRHDEFKKNESLVPFLVYKDLERTGSNYSKESNWHEDIEIQFCTQGSGYVMLNGEKYDFCKGDIASVNSNVIHYTGTEKELVYSCIIIGAQFCRSVGYDYRSLLISPVIKDEELSKILADIILVYHSPDYASRELKLNQLILSVLVILAQRHSEKKANEISDNRSFDTVRKAVQYIRENYERKITLDEISKAVLADKYSLCRNFKKLTGQTLVENLNEYRCLMAKEYLSQGTSVAESARLCGFENISFFTKTFKRHTGMLPSHCKNS